MSIIYNLEGRFAETGGYPEWKEDQTILLEKYNKVKQYLCDHNNVGVDEDQLLYHLCYDCNMELWLEVFDIVKRIGERSGVALDWEEMKHLLKFTFMWTKPRGKLMPHTAHNLRAMSSFNIPLTDNCEIILYDRKGGKNLMFPGSDTYEIARHHYHNPAFLNVNKLHGLENNTDEERIILKTHFLITPIERAVAATVSHDKTPQRQLEYAPWMESKFKQKFWNNGK